MKKLFDSKRFVAYIISVIIFVVCVIVTNHDPITLATAIGGLSGIYIGFESWKPSPKKIEDNA